MNIPKNFDSVTLALSKEEDLLFERSKEIGVKNAIEEYLISHIPEPEKKLKLDISVSELSDCFISAAESYVEARDKGVTTTQLNQAIRDNAYDTNNADPVVYLSSLIFIGELFNGRYKNMSRDEIISQFTHICSFEPEATREEKIETLLEQIDAKALNMYRCVDEEGFADSTVLSSFLAELPDSVHYSIRSAVFYKAAIKGEISGFDSDIHPALFASFICCYSDSAAIIDKQMRDEISSLEASQLLNKVGTALSGALVFLLFLFLILAIPLALIALLTASVESVGLTILICCLVILLVQLPAALTWTYLSEGGMDKFLSRFDSFRKYPSLPLKQHNRTDFIKSAIPHIKANKLATS